MPEALVRRYEPRDRAALCRICYDTGLMGESVDPLFGCEKLFTDYWMTYYLEYEPAAAFVAVVDDVPVGYLVGCSDTARFERVQQTDVWPRIWRRLFTGRYGVPVRLMRFLWHVLRSQASDATLTPPLAQYPAHLHMNLAPPHRQRGYGSQLMAAYLAHLEAAQVPGVHLITTNLNRLAVPFYEKWGFQLHDRAPVSLYRTYVPEPVEALMYVRPVRQPASVEA